MQYISTGIEAITLMIKIMKKLFLLFAFAAMASMTYAQTFEVVELKEKSKTENMRGPFLTNRLFDNIFIQIGAGGQTWNKVTLPSGEQYNWRDQVTPAFEIAVGKWLAPNYGVRLMWQGEGMKGYSMQPGAFSNDVSDAKWGNFSWKAHYWFLHADFLFNLSNAIGGYKPTRTYEFIPFVGFGFARSNSGKSEDTPIGYRPYSANNEFAVSLGFINKFRISNRVDFNIEFKSMLTRQSFFGSNVSGYIGALPSLTGGFTFRLGRTDFTNAATVVAEALEAAGMDNASYANRISDLEDELAASQARAERLANQLKKAEQTKPTQPKVEKVATSAPLAVFFQIGKATISRKDMINLQYMAEAIKEDPNKKYQILGFADKETGSEEFNQQLSEQRAENVKNLLVKKYDINPDQLEAKGLGTSQQPFDAPTLNRVVIVE